MRIEAETLRDKEDSVEPIATEPEQKGRDGAVAESPAPKPEPRLYRVIWRWHFYAGLLTLPVLLTAAVTGGIYVFREELERVIYPRLMFVEPQPQRISYNEQLANVAAALPAGSTTGIPVYDLPSLGYIETVKKRGQLARETAIVVGYGVASLGRGPATSNFDGIRRVAETRVLSIQGPFLLIADSHGQSGQGGTCGGDSGGPVFLSQDPTLIIAITTAGFPEGCHAIGIYTRLDTEAALTFLSQFVTL